METEVSREAEEYLEAIYRLQIRRGVAKTTELASELNVVPGSVTNTIQNLKKRGLVKHEPYRGVKLTAKGEKIALRILRRHRLAERLLTDILNAEWNSVHENACKLEHALTKEVITLLEKKLGYPKSCPHGNPIPSANGKVEEGKFHPLTEANINKACIVARIIDEKQEILLILASKGIRLGATVRVVERKSFGIILYVAEKKHTLNNDVASIVLVKSMENKELARRK
ncbi:MAG: metal-dependent transcriptional regulator [Candidatus Bathyarchaeota archaeon]|nr:metal-dependent transcriptional regulator [Candidatus Bathyarchaeota archaeon]MDH5746248.1 metal-dependent transcriptional regulator [Candidatus Bathyarchaeota archaeon]